MKAILRFDNIDVYREGEFADTEPVTIGREPDNKVAMQLGVLSRHHAKVFFENGSWFVQDLDSANGSFFRGKQLAPNAKVELVNGDIVHFGTVAMSISLAVSDGAQMKWRSRSKRLSRKSWRRLSRRKSSKRFLSPRS